MRAASSYTVAFRFFAPLLAVAIAGCGHTDPASTGSSAGTTAGGASSGAGGAATTSAGQSSGGAAPSGGTPNSGGAGAGNAGMTTTAGTSSGGSSGGVAGNAGASVGGAGGMPPRGCPTVADFMTWPSGKDPATIGKLAVGKFGSHTGDLFDSAGYALIFGWQSSMKLNLLPAVMQSNASLISAFDPYLNGTKTVLNDPATPTDAGSWVDKRVFGALPLQIYLENQDTRYLDLGMARATMQWSCTKDSTIPCDARYWIDDMYMITELQVMAYRAKKEAMYLDRAAQLMLAYIKRLQQTPTGTEGSLFLHINQCNKESLTTCNLTTFDQSTLISLAYWGRANGWVAAGMTELLLELPAGAVRDRIMAAYKKQMDGLLPLQITVKAATDAAEDVGCWRQVLDYGDAAPAETSATAMFTFALATGVKNGWLTDAKYAQSARAGWLALASKTTGGELNSVCPGTGEPKVFGLAAQQRYYIDQMKGSQLGDQHGQAPLLWAAHALLRADCPGVR